MSRWRQGGWLAGLALFALAGCDGSSIIQDCQSSAAIDVFCGFAKPEDLTDLPNSGWILVSELGNRGEPGDVAAIRPADGALIRLEVTVEQPTKTVFDFPICGLPPARLKPRGFHLSVNADDTRLLVVNAESGLRIEAYRVVSVPEPALIWLGCVAVPQDITPNDVAAMPDGGFVVSHMYTPPRGRLLTLRFMLGMNTGYAARWQPDAGWSRIPGSDASFPNGIQTDPATGRVFVASTYGQDLTAVDPDGGNRRRVSLPVQPDNLSWSPDGRLLAAGHTGVPMLGTSGCREVGDTPCAFPFAVAAIDPATLEVETIYAHSGGQIPGASVALMYDGALYLGTFFGDRISRVVPHSAL
jgi:DNA-binding beta-propeller fold protein YncE